MAELAPDLQRALDAAQRAQKEGRAIEAVRILQTAISSSGPHPVALNRLGLACLAAAKPMDAVAAFTEAAAADPGALPLWINLADAQRCAGNRVDEIAALDRALTIDAYSLPALIAKGAALEALGEGEAAAKTYRGLLAAYPDPDAVAPAARPALLHARAVVDKANELKAARLREATASVFNDYPDAEWHRSRVYLEQLSGRRRIYAPQPVAGHFPFLPAYEFFDERLFPWLPKLEEATAIIRDELLARWNDDPNGPEPYVAFPAGAPVNQWANLNHSPRWGAYFLWRDGVPQVENMERCPLTVALMQQLPILHLPGKGPTVMFSILQPHTHIPAHTGSTNIRGTVHLPLVLPGKCRFRVGGETRSWEMGRAWVFDDTIEHEAWNDSDQPRAILIFDCWNPFLTEAERQLIRAAGG